MRDQTVTEFLEARIDEDEERASSGWSSLRDTRWETDNYGRNFLTPAAVLAECKAKRALLAKVPRNTDPYDPEGYTSMHTIRALAVVYAGHPDYQQEWAL